MSLSSALAAGMCQSIAAALGGWKTALATPAALTALAFAVCLCALGNMRTGLVPAEKQMVRIRLVTGKNLAIALFIGLQSFLFFSILTWLPSMAGAKCDLGTASGKLLLLAQCCNTVPALLLPPLCQRTRRKGLLALCSTLIFILGFLLLLLLGQSIGAVFLAAGLLGVASGATMSIGLTFVSMQGANAAETARISAFTQCIGYVLASFGPTGIGFIYDALDHWTPVLICLIVFSLVMAAVGIVVEKV